jgi:hypothetical protein
MAQHVRMRLEAKLGRFTSALDHAGESGRRERRAALRGEHERRFRVLLALCVAGVPFLALRTASVAVLKSIWSQRRSTSSLALSPCR